MIDLSVLLRHWPARKGVVVSGCVASAMLAIAATTAWLVWPTSAAGDLISWQGPQPADTPQASIAAPASAPAGLKTIDYSPAPDGFPADPEPMSTRWLAEGAHPSARIVAYDAPGGVPRAYLAPTINGVPLTMPIVERRGTWAAVILPSANRSIAWIAQGSWTVVALRDQVVIHRSKHELTWMRDGAAQQTWSATMGASSTPTPLGRTFVLGRSTAKDKVYAGLDVIALGGIPDNIDALPAGLRGAHTGIHSWYTADGFGKSISNGCIRVPQPAQRLLLTEIEPGTEVVIVE